MTMTNEPDTDLPTVTRATLGSPSQSGQADGILGALQDLSRNRLPLPQAVRIHNARKRVQEAITEREEVRRDLIRQYDDTGQGWKDAEDAPDELLEKVAALMAEEVELDLGPPVTLNGEATDVDLTPDSYAVLDAIGFLKIEGEGED